MATSVQFSIRSLLIAMVLAAIVLALATPVIGSWGTAAQIRFLVNAATLAVSVAIFMILRCAMRRHTERQAGPVFLHAATRGTRFARLFHVLLLLLFLAGLFFFAAVEATSRPSPKPPYVMVRWGFVAYLGWLAAWLITNCWWGTGAGIVELAEHGLIEGGIRFTPYSRFRTFRWHPYYRDVLVVSTRDYRPIHIIIPRSQRESIHRFLKEKRLISSQTPDSQEDSGQMDSGATLRKAPRNPKP